MYGTPFLKLVADDIIKKYRDMLPDLVVVFPNNRAQLFFNDFLIQAANGQTIWSPSYTTIKQLFESQSKLQITDPIELVCRLFEVYSEIAGGKSLNSSDEVYEPETLDVFYHWGEILLSDFDDVDNNLVDAAMLFRNIKETVPFEGDTSHLTDEQRETLSRFFKVFRDGEDTKLKKRFLQLWEILGDVYARFKTSLLGKGIAYEGMLKRSVVEEIEKNGLSLQGRTYLFVGFNVLNQCERKLFRKMHDAKMAKFYWDCDEFYMTHDGQSRMVREAGLFMRANISEFQNEIDAQSLLKEKRKINVVGSPTENAQARYVSSFLNNRPSGAKDDDTVVVLCNESLLLPVLHSIPEDVSANHVNVTMGLPLAQTPMYGVVQLLLDFQERLNFLDVDEKGSMLSTTILPLVRNHYLRKAYPDLVDIENRITRDNWRYFKMSDLLGKECGMLFKRQNDTSSLLSWLSAVVLSIATLFRRNDDDDEAGQQYLTDPSDGLYDDLYKESLYRIYTLLKRIQSLVNNGVLKTETALTKQLVESVLSSASVPFTGSQSEGLQIMGFLETRNLDFSNVILLSANENVLPKSGKENTFIPYSLRKGYGMTTVEHKNSLYAYYFYRLLQRAENITLMYNTSTETNSKGQMSRFIMQLMVETDYDFLRSTIGTNTPKKESARFSVEKTDEIMQKLYSMYDKNSGGTRTFSPSSLNMYLDCPFRFYLSKILHVDKPEELSDDVEVNEFGTIFHATMEYFYNDLMEEVKRSGRDVINSSDYPENLKSPEFIRKIEGYVMKAFKEKYFHIEDEKEGIPELSGVQMINRDAIVRYALAMFALDKEYAPFKVVGTEKKCVIQMEISIDQDKKVEVEIYGEIDRLDEKDGKLRVVDYKTGGKSKKIESVEGLFDPNTKDRYKYGLQVMMYAYMYGKQNQVEGIKPSIAYLKDAKCTNDLDLTLGKDGVVEDAMCYSEEIEDGLKNVMAEVFDPGVPFVARKENKNACRYCDFTSLCGVKVPSW